MGIKERLKRAKEELSSKCFWKSLRAEFLGSILYMIFGCGSTIVWTKDGSSNVLALVFSCGSIYAILIKILGPISGAHFNPSITIALLCTRYTTLIKGISFIFVQLLGFICGAAILYGVIPEELQSDLGVTRIQTKVDNSRAFGIEFLATFSVIIAYFSTLENKNDVLVPDHIICGLSVSLSQLFAFNLTGASINPARSFGPALIKNIWEHHWVYWIGPILGGILGGFTHEYLNKSTPDLKQFQTSLRQRVYTLQRKEDVTSSNSLTTEVAADQETTEELQM